MAERPDEWLRVVAPGKRPLGVDVLLVVERRNDDAAPVAARKLGIHHEPGEAPVAVIEGVDVGHQEGVEDGPGQTLGNARREPHPLEKGSAHEGRLDELRGAGEIGLLLELPRCCLWPA